MGARAGRPNSALCGAVIVGLLLSGCTSDAEPQTASPSTAVGSPREPSSPASATPSPVESPSPSADHALTININIRGGKTFPNGVKINVRVGQQVILDVMSDIDDQIHAHIGGEGYELPVRAGRPARGSFTIDGPGSFEVESHHLEKIIVILNAR